MENVIDNVEIKKDVMLSFSLKDNLIETLDNLNFWIENKKSTLSNQNGENNSTDFQFELAEVRGQIVREFGIEIYETITNKWTDMFRTEEFLYLLAEQFPGMAPTRAEIESDNKFTLLEKQGYEISQGVLVSNFLAHPKIGFHMMEAMRLPKKESLNYLTEFMQSGEIEFSTIKLSREGNVGNITISSIKSLNAEDSILNDELEIAVDLCLMDTQIEVGVMRGDFMEHVKYKDKRVFCSGVNLTKLYYGAIPYTFYVERELGLMSKILRGQYSRELPWEDGIDKGIEKPFITVVDTHAIGGGCQMVLIADVVIAASDSYFTIPARTEGFIPGVANFRIQRYMGQRLARKMINFNHKVLAASVEGEMLTDFVVDPSEIDSTLTNVLNDICGSGIHGMVSNRKAFRIGAESVDNFRRYMVMFSKEQVRCMFNNEIIKNLEKIWIKKNK